MLSTETTKVEQAPVCISNDAYTLNLEWVHKSYRAAIAGEPVPCRGCEKTFELIKLFRCFHCGSFFCGNCARDHFGERPGRLFEVMSVPVQVMCLDMECQCRDECFHARPHKKTDECTEICSIDGACSRCLPVAEHHD